MKIGTVLSLAPSQGVRHVGIKCLAGKALGRDGLLLVIDPFAVLISRADEYRRARRDRRDPMPGDRAVLAKHKYVVTDDLVIIRGKVSGIAALIVTVWHFAVGLHAQMAAE